MSAHQVFGPSTAPRDDARPSLMYTHFFYEQLLYKQGSTRQGKKLSNFSTGLKTAKQFEKCVNGALGRSPTKFGKSYYLD